VFRDHVIQLFKELNLESGELPKDLTTVSLEVEGTDVVLSDTQPGLELSATLGDVPAERTEPLYLKLLRANFLGQATKGACLGIDEEGRHIVISQSIPTVRSYRQFHDIVEDFINAVSFWKHEVLA
jgi:hypothetical protein